MFNSAQTLESRETTKITAFQEAQRLSDEAGESREISTLANQEELT
jgi:hypothetical protein